MRICVQVLLLIFSTFGSAEIVHVLRIHDQPHPTAAESLIEKLGVTTEDIWRVEAALVKPLGDFHRLRRDEALDDLIDDTTAKASTNYEFSWGKAKYQGRSCTGTGFRSDDSLLLNRRRRLKSSEFSFTIYLGTAQGLDFDDSTAQANAAVLDVAETIWKLVTSTSTYGDDDEKPTPEPTAGPSSSTPTLDPVPTPNPTTPVPTTPSPTILDTSGNCWMLTWSGSTDVSAVFPRSNNDKTDIADKAFLYYYKYFANTVNSKLGGTATDPKILWWGDLKVVAGDYEIYIDDRGGIGYVTQDDSKFSQAKLWKNGSPWDLEIIDDVEASCGTALAEDVGKYYFVELGELLLFTFGAALLEFLLARIGCIGESDPEVPVLVEDQVRVHDKENTIRKCLMPFNYISAAVSLTQALVDYYLVMAEDGLTTSSVKCGFYLYLALPLSRNVFLNLVIITNCIVEYMSEREDTSSCGHLSYFIMRVPALLYFFPAVVVAIIYALPALIMYIEVVLLIAAIGRGILNCIGTTVGDRKAFIFFVSIILTSLWHFFALHLTRIYFVAPPVVGDETFVRNYRYLLRSTFGALRMKDWSFKLFEWPEGLPHFSQFSFGFTLTVLGFTYVMKISNILRSFSGSSSSSSESTTAKNPISI